MARKRVQKPPVIVLLVLLYAALAVLFTILIRHGQMQLLEPAGYIANIQSHLLWGVILLGGLAAFLLIGSFFFVAFRYHEGRQARYEPGWTVDRKVLLAGWGIPLIVIVLISIVLWNTAHQVDPYRPISSSNPAITIQVVALRWKWLFIYPNDRLATVNQLEIPVGTPIAFQLTADAPMNSFWVPRLSGQVMAMTGMVTRLHVEADRPGTYPGSSGEMSGDGFSGMDFNVKAVPATEYNTWKNTALTQASDALNYSAYTRLASPSSYVTPAVYTLPDANLFQEIVMQFMVPGADPSTLDLRGMPL